MKSILFAGQTRHAPAVKRAENQPARISGLGAVFFNASDVEGTEYWLWDDVRERIAPGAFNDQLSGDVRSFFNHDDSMVLGRTTSGTLRLSVTAQGLAYDVTPPNAAAWLIENIERGDVNGASFMFNVLRASWTEEVINSRTIYTRIIEALELLEVGPVTWPAYTGTTATLQRSLGSSGQLFDTGVSQARYRAWFDAHCRSARADLDRSYLRPMRHRRGRDLRAAQLKLLQQ